MGMKWIYWRRTQEVCDRTRPKHHFLSHPFVLSGAPDLSFPSIYFLLYSVPFLSLLQCVTIIYCYALNLTVCVCMFICFPLLYSLTLLNFPNPRQRYINNLTLPNPALPRWSVLSSPCQSAFPLLPSCQPPPPPLRHPPPLFPPRPAHIILHLP